MNLKELARKAVSTLFLSMLCLVAFAQTATGLVKDKTGEPMIGVNVLVKGTTNGTITDFDGKFSIPDVPSNATLVVSYIGYLTKEVKTGKDLVIVLEEDNKTAPSEAVVCAEPPTLTPSKSNATEAWSGAIIPVASTNFPFS